MERLTSEEFLEKINASSEWLVEINENHEPQLTVKYDLDSPFCTFLGPDPGRGSWRDYMLFRAKLEMVNYPTVPEVDMNLPRLTTDEFFKKIEDAVQWSTILHKDGWCIELLAVMPNGKFEHYLSVDTKSMLEIESATFIALIDALQRQRDWEGIKEYIKYTDQ